MIDWTSSVDHEVLELRPTVGSEYQKNGCDGLNGVVFCRHTIAFAALLIRARLPLRAALHNPLRSLDGTVGWDEANKIVLWCAGTSGAASLG